LRQLSIELLEFAGFLEAAAAGLVALLAAAGAAVTLDASGFGAGLLLVPELELAEAPLLGCRSR